MTDSGDCLLDFCVLLGTAGSVSAFSTRPLVQLSNIGLTLMMPRFPKTSNVQWSAKGLVGFTSSLLSTACLMMFVSFFRTRCANNNSGLLFAHSLMSFRIFQKTPTSSSSVRRSKRPLQTFIQSCFSFPEFLSSQARLFSRRIDTTSCSNLQFNFPRFLKNGSARKSIKLMLFVMVVVAFRSRNGATSCPNAFSTSPGQ